MIVYMIYNKVNGKRYIGQTVTELNARWLKHLSDAHRGNTRCAVHSAIRKYGRENFSVYVIDETDSINDLNMLEKHYIQMYETLVPNGYNLQHGGDNHLPHPETIEKCRQAGMRATHHKGNHPSTATRILLSKSHVGKKFGPMSEERKKKITEAAKRRETNGMLGRNHTPESKEMMSSRRRLYRIDADEMCRLYLAGWTASQIGRLFGCHGGTIRLRLIKEGVTMRVGKKGNYILNSFGGCGDEKFLGFYKSLGP